MFDTLLDELVQAVPGARGACFCDDLGESVTAIGASGRVSPTSKNDFDLRIAAAQLATPIDLACRHATEHMGALRELVIRGTHETLAVHLLRDGYYLVLCLAPGSLVARGQHHLRQTARRVLDEM